MADQKKPKDTSVEPMTTQNSPGLTGGQRQGQGPNQSQGQGGGSTFDVTHARTGEKRTVTEEQYRNENLEEQGFRKPGRL